MPLENASDAASMDMDPFGDPSDQLADSENPYPSFTPLAPLSVLLGYTENDRQRYMELQAQNTARLLNLDFTPLERAGLAYYDSIFYTYESYGDLLGTSTGLTIGYAMRKRPAGPIARGITRILGRPHAGGYVAAAIRLLVFGAAGRMYGLTSAGLQALNRMRGEQSRDPGMARIVAARAARSGALEKETKMRRRAPTMAMADGDDDAQSLGGMEIADQVRQGDEAAAREQSRAFPFGRPSEKVAELEKARGGGEMAAEATMMQDEGDPFAVGAAKQAPGETPQTAWRNTHSSTAESTWERLRRGQGPAVQTQRGGGGGGSGGADEAVPRTSPWPARAPMKGFGSGNVEPKMDSFSFAGAGDKDLERIQAQKEFDESVERERRSGAGDGYSEGDKGGKGGRGWN